MLVTSMYNARYALPLAFQVAVFRAAGPVLNESTLGTFFCAFVALDRQSK